MLKTLAICFVILLGVAPVAGQDGLSDVNFGYIPTEEIEATPMVAFINTLTAPNLLEQSTLTLEVNFSNFDEPLMDEATIESLDAGETIQYVWIFSVRDGSEAFDTIRLINSYYLVVDEDAKPLEFTTRLPHYSDTLGKLIQRQTISFETCWSSTDEPTCNLDKNSVTFVQRGIPALGWPIFLLLLGTTLLIVRMRPVSKAKTK